MKSSDKSFRGAEIDVRPVYTEPIEVVEKRNDLDGDYVEIARKPGVCARRNFRPPSISSEIPHLSHSNAADSLKEIGDEANKTEREYT